MPLSDTLQLETQQAFRELDALQGRLDRISDVRLDVTLDTSTLNADIDRTRSLAEQTASAFGRVEDQVVLTTDEYRQAVSAIERGVDASRAVEQATGRIADEALSVDAALGRVATTLGISEREAADLAGQVGRSTRESLELDSDLRQVARSMGLSEEEARLFVRQVREGASVTGRLEEATSGLQASWARIAGRAGAVVAAALGIRQVFQSGFERFTTIEDATAALTIQLDDAGQAADVLAGTLEVVRGTPFNLDQFADAAAQLISFGTEAREIPGILTAIGEAAATRGGRAPEFVERLVQLFGQITTQGRISGEQITRFAETGVNALVILANTFGVTTDEIREMVSNGLIPADEAIAAITTGIIEGTEGAAGATVALGGTMEGLRDTLSGAQGGLGAAVARFGENLIEAASPAILSWLQAATAGFDNLGGAIDGAGSTSGAQFLLDGLADLPRGLATVGDVAGGTSRAVLNLAEGFAGLLSFNLVGDVRNFGEALDEVKGSAENISIRIIEQDVVSALRDGVNAASAFDHALRGLADQGSLSGDTIARFAAITGATDADVRRVVRSLLNTAAAAELSEEEIIDLQIALGAFSEAAQLDDLEGADRLIANYAANLADVAEAAEGAEEEIDPLVVALDAVAGVAEDTGASIGFILNNLSQFGPEVQEAVSGLEPGAVRAQAFADALDGLALATDIDFSDAVDEFELLISVTNEAGDEVPATVEQMLSDLQAQADRFARLEAATTILEALGFDSLAAELRSQGPDAADAAEEFIDDIASAIEAEDILDKGGQVGDDLLTGLQDALEQGTITPELLDLVSEFTSTQVQQSVINQAVELGGLFGRELLAAIDLRTDIRIPVNLIPEIQGSTGGVDPTGAGAISGGSGATNVPGGVQVNQTNNFNGTQVTGTDVARITQSTASVIREQLR